MATGIFDTFCREVSPRKRRTNYDRNFFALIVETVKFFTTPTALRNMHTGMTAITAQSSNYSKKCLQPKKKAGFLCLEESLARSLKLRLRRIDDSCTWARRARMGNGHTEVNDTLAEIKIQGIYENNSSTICIPTLGKKARRRTVGNTTKTCSVSPETSS